MMLLRDRKEMLVRALLLTLVAGTALCLDLEAVQRTAHFPQHKRGESQRLLSELMSRHMAHLLPALLQEQDRQPADENLLSLRSQRMAAGRLGTGSKRSMSKRVARKKDSADMHAEEKGKPTSQGPRLLDGGVRALSALDASRHAALTKRDAKVLGELRQIFSEEQEEPRKKTVRKREDVADLSNVATGKKNESDEEKFKKWLLDEYYRTMALSFASMRKKRMASTRQFSLPSDAPMDPAQEDDRFQAAEERLRTLEESLLSEALALERGGADGGPAEGRVAARLDAAYDLESVRRALDHLHNALRIIQAQDEQEDSIKPEASQCRVLQVLASGCSTVEGFLPLNPAFKNRLIAACTWHEVCYTCGALYGLSPDDCDEGFSDGEPAVLGVQQRAKRNAPAACSAPCVQEFLGNP